MHVPYGVDGHKKSNTRDDHKQRCSERVESHSDRNRKWASAVFVFANSRSRNCSMRVIQSSLLSAGTTGMLAVVAVWSSVNMTSRRVESMLAMTDLVAARAVVMRGCWLATG